MKRRNFIKSTCMFCAAALTGGAMTTLLSSCSSEQFIGAEMQNGRIVLPLHTMLDRKTKIIRAKQYDNDIALCYSRNGELVALVMQCTHFPNPIIHRDAGFYCSVHGSSFDSSGQVTHGPAIKPLKTLKVSILPDSILIDTLEANQ